MGSVPSRLYSFRYVSPCVVLALKYNGNTFGRQKLLTHDNEQVLEKSAWKTEGARRRKDSACDGCKK